MLPNFVQLCKATACSIAMVFLMINTLGHAMNVSHFYDAPFRPLHHMDKRFSAAVLAEHGIKTRSFDEDGCAANVLRIWDKEQDALKMLAGFPVESAIGQLLTRLTAVDDGVRGHFLTDGCLELIYNTTFAARYSFHENFIFGAYLPVISMRLNNVAWENLTQNIDDQDHRVREYLTNDFFANVETLGGLHLGNWKRTGLGDLTFLLEWLNDFPQPKPLLKNVRLNARLGLVAPTGKRQNEDLIFALPFGNDGAWGLLWAGGLDLTLGSYAKAGLDVQLTHFFGNTKIRRIKTDSDQTELLLLQKACVYKDWGLTQQFNLYFEFFQFYKGLSCKVDYQFIRHGENELGLLTQDFSNTIANTARSLQEWTSHNAIIKLNYDFAYNDDCDVRAKPQVALFVKTPFNGKQSALFTTIGALASVDF